MKIIALTVTCLLAVSGALAGAGDSCYQDVSLECAATSNSLKLPRCNARYANYGEHGAVATELQAYAGLHLRRSYEYLLSSAFFNNYQTNRKGFTQLFRKLSDDAWSKTIGLIKHITMRGDQMDFTRRSRHDSAAKNHTVELNELEALSRALDSQKELAERAFHIHREATRNSQDLHDPEITQYLEEEFIEYQAKTIRSLAGHAADLKRFITTNGGQDVSLAYYLFDEYLQKAA